MSLDDKDLEQIKQIIADTVKAVFTTTIPIKKPRKPYKKREPKAVVQPPIDIQPKSAIIQPQGRIRRIGQNTQTSQVVKGGSNKGKQCRTEPVNLTKNRPNLFIQSSDANLFKSDIAIDKKLSGKNVPTPRRQEAEMWEIECKICHRLYIVSPSILMVDPETQEVAYTCDNCIRR